MWQLLIIDRIIENLLILVNLFHLIFFSRYTKPQNFADCIGDELPLGWEEAYDPVIGPYFISHITQSTQIEDPRHEWKGVQEEMLKEYLCSAQEALEAKREIYDVKQQRLLLAQDEYNHLNALAASRTSLYSSSSSISTRIDPDLLKADVILSKERVERLKRELAQINSEISFTQKGVDTLYSVEQKLISRENGCYNIKEVQEIKEQIMVIQKSIVYGENQKEDLKKNLSQLKTDLSKLHPCEESPDASAFNLAQDRASQTDLSSDIFPVGARLAEMTKMKLQYDEWRKRIKLLQQQLVDHVERIEPGQLESDKDRLLLISEKEQYLKELRSIAPKSRPKDEMIEIRETCLKLELDIRNAFKASSQCISDRLRLQEEKDTLLQQLQESLRSTQLLEDRIKSLSLGSTFSISSGSSVGSLSTASSKGSLSGLSFTDIYGDPLSTVDHHMDVANLHRRIRLSHPSEASISSRSSLNDAQNKLLQEEPMYENTRNLELYNAAFDCVELEKRLHELDNKNSSGMMLPLSTIYEKSSPPENHHHQCNAISRMSSVSNSRSVSAAVSNESVAGDSGVFEASRALLPNKESAQVQIGLKYSKSDFILHIAIERARNLTVLCLPNKCEMYFKAALLPGTTTEHTFRTNNFTDFQKPLCSGSFAIPILLSKLFTKTLQVNVMCVFGQREECVVSFF